MSLPFFPNDFEFELLFQKDAVDKLVKKEIEKPRCRECNHPLVEIGKKRKKLICQNYQCKIYKEKQ